MEFKCTPDYETAKNTVHQKEDVFIEQIPARMRRPVIDENPEVRIGSVKSSKASEEELINQAKDLTHENIRIQCERTD